MTPIHLCAPHLQITKTLHYLQKLYENLGYLCPKIDPGDSIPTIAQYSSTYTLGLIIQQSIKDFIQKYASKPISTQQSSLEYVPTEKSSYVPLKRQHFEVITKIRSKTFG